MIAPVVSMGIGCFLAWRNRQEHGSELGAFRHVVERSPANIGQFKLIATRLKKYET